jgi:uncharacterized protein (TIGR00255 family)
MPVYSMTGFASASTGAANVADDTPAASAAVTVEMRSVNGRFLDLSLKMPDELRALEPALRELVGAHLKRGKVELRVASARDADGAWPRPSTDILNRLAQLESTVRGWLPEARPLSVNEVLQWCRGQATTDKLDDQVLDAARRCAVALVDARAREGDRLRQLIEQRLAKLRDLAVQAGPLLPAVVQRQQQRFLERWNDALGAAGAGSTVNAEALQERALGEAATFALRIDVAEELGRLNAHLDEIGRLLAQGGELGKRLDFLIQELHREANTLGSKSAALELTAISVEMKVLIEQMREQAQNLE